MGAQFTWTSSEGAILHLPRGAARLSSPPELFRDVALRGAKNWYRFANITLRRGVPNGSLYLITGCDKARSWMVGSFSDSSSESQASFKLNAAGFGGGRVAYSYSWETSCPAVYRTGPPPSIDSPDDLHQHEPEIDRDNHFFQADAPDGQNQCVFLRGYRIMLRTSPISLVLGGSTKTEVLSISATNPKDISQPPSKSPYTQFPAVVGDPGCSDKYRSHTVPRDSPCSLEGPDVEVAMEYIPDVDEVCLYPFPRTGLVTNFIVFEPYHPSTSINNFLLRTVNCNYPQLYLTLNIIMCFSRSPTQKLPLLMMTIGAPWFGEYEGFLIFSYRI